MRIDLNADVAESPDDLALLDVVTSANVCCGAYAGGEELMLDACERAVERGVVVGAQVGYPDREGFGRRPQEPTDDELVATLREQLDLLAEVADAVGARVAYVKPHGALYNTVVHDEQQAAAVVEAVAPYGLPLLGLPGAASLRLAAADGLQVVAEGFADRAYTPDGLLMPRSEPGAVLTDVDAVAAQALRLAPQVDSLCVHGDSPGALDLARAVRAALADAGHHVTPFA
ncbi:MULTISPECIES: 5-oxoprolinase subunit PxpA [unclassified Aeromicrobium]|uniref:5-oxoprolinase subunit PxpA n=1 Tax=unclassified Aeromicrobium TaxID=2633570 RepID=UPI000A7614A2|nr:MULTISPECIES: 5-oxoprolinase subunit PxpA [unclassified Aeromicrobium]